MSKEKITENLKDQEIKTNRMWYAYAAASTALSGISCLFNEQKIYSYYNNFGWDYNYRLYQSFKNLDNHQNKILSEFTKNKQYAQFLRTYPEKIQYVLGLPIDERNSFITEAMKEQHAYEILLRDSFTDDQEIKYSDYLTGHPASDTLKTNIAGPWNIDSKSHRLMKNLGENIHFDTLLKALALDNLDTKNNQRRLLFAPIIGNGGYADYLGSVFISTFTVSEEAFKGVSIHELSHRGIMLSNQYLNYNANPYPKSSFKNPQVNNFEIVMKQTLINLHQQFIPNIIPPLSIKELAINLERHKKNLTPKDKNIVDNISNNLFLNQVYGESQYHTEFVVRLPHIIAELGELPPHIRDCFAPLEEYYKTQITPRWLDYIENHPRKAMLLPNNMDKYHPETILNLSGEDELMAKDPQKLSKPEKLLIVQIQKMQDFIKDGDVAAARTYLAELQDERVIRASLRACIEHESPLFNEVFQAIKAPQYLGPQLVLAAKLNRNEMTVKLLPQITNQYYLSRAVEIALESNDHDLLHEAILGIKDEWFLSRSENNPPNNAIVTKAITDIIIEKGINYLKDTHPDQLQTGLIILQSPSIQDFIKNKIDNLNYLITLNEDSLNKALTILENLQFKDWIGKNDYYTKSKFDYLVTLDKEQLNTASEILAVPQFNDWMDKNSAYMIDKFSYLTNLDKDQLNTALEILAETQFKDWINKNDHYAMKKLDYLVTLDKDQLNTALEILAKPQLKEWIDNDTYYAMKKLDYLVTVNKDQQLMALKILSSETAGELIKNDLTALQNLLKTPNEQLTSQLKIELRTQNNISLPVINTALPSVFENHNMISAPDKQILDKRQNISSTGNIISQAALTISLAYAAKSIYIVLKKLLVNDREVLTPDSDTKDLDKKLISLHNQFKALVNFLLVQKVLL